MSENFSWLNPAFLSSRLDVESAIDSRFILWGFSSRGQGLFRLGPFIHRGRACVEQVEQVANDKKTAQALEDPTTKPYLK